MKKSIIALTAVTALLALGSGPAAAQESADSIYRAARSQLNRTEYRRAVETFETLRDRYPQHRDVPDSYYWQAFALQRTGDYRRALELLDSQMARYPRASTHSQATQLRTRLCGELAQRGDSRCAAEIAQAAAPERGEVDEETRMAALQALLNMRAERAIPILRELLANPGNYSREMRQQAVFLIADKADEAEATEILLNVVRNDPDPEIRSRAVFWLSEVDDAAALDALIDILLNSTDRELQDKAIFAIAQHGDPRGMQALRDFALDNTVPTELRGQAIFWIGEEGGSSEAGFLRDIYSRTNSRELKDKVIFAISQLETPEAVDWLIGVAQNESEPLQLRKQALFWAGEAGASIEQIVGLYDSASDREIKDQLIFVLSESGSPQAVDKLMDIARNDADPEVRQKAIFWLGQSDDPRATDFLVELIQR